MLSHKKNDHHTGLKILCPSHLFMYSFLGELSVKNFILFFMVVVICLFDNLANATFQALPPVALFARCYGQITGHPLPMHHNLIRAVKSGQITPINACLSVFNKALLSNDNHVIAGSSDGEAVSILNTFNNFHRSWFSATKIEDIIDHGPDTGVGTSDIYDPSEPALAITYHLFKPSSSYSAVLTDNFGFVGLREENMTIKNLFGYTVGIPSRRLYGNNTIYDQNNILFRAAGLDPAHIHGFFGDTSTNVQLQMPKIQVGDLVGISPQNQTFMVPNIVLAPLTGDVRDGTLETDFNYSYNFYSSFGGGVLGQPIYLMMNLGHPKGLTFTGAEKLPRRWIYNSMQTFLCTQFPALREADVVNFIDTGGTAPFRKGTSCLQCHASMDQAAFTARNIVAAGSEFNTFGPSNPKTTDTISSYKVTAAAQTTWPSSAVANFHHQAPSGTLYFRSVTGTLINQSVNGISGLGSAMANTDDFYQCAAKRYFEFFTGISVSLYDRTDPRFSSVNSSLTKNNIIDRQFVEKLGADLKSSQSLSQLIKNILSSDYYKTSNFRPLGSP